MNEAQIKQIPALAALPIHDESDPSAHSIMRGKHRNIRECTSISEVDACLSDPNYVAIAAVRVRPAGNEILVVYFGEPA